MRATRTSSSMRGQQETYASVTRLCPTLPEPSVSQYSSKMVVGERAQLFLRALVQFRSLSFAWRH